jgi:hypothetical protein
VLDAVISLGRLAAAGSGLVYDRLRPARQGDLPFSLADLTPGWLEAALAPVAPGVRVASFEHLDTHSGTTTRARIRLDYADPGRGPKPPETLFVKIAPHAPLQRLFLTCTGIGRNEVAFYRHVRPGLPVRAPEVYAAETRAGGRDFVLLLEDLACGGACFPKVGDRVALEQARAVVCQLARLHAAYWESPRFAADLAWVPCRENRGRDMPWERFVTGQMIRLALRRFARDFPPAFCDIAELVLHHRDGLERLWAEGERSLVHGDCHLGNLFFEADDVGFLDWQVSGRAPGMRDVSYFLSNSFPTALRQQHERELIGLYRERLSEAGAAGPSADVAWSQHRAFAVYTWLAATFTAAAGSGLQPREIALAGMRRTTQAANDLDSVADVRSRLGL